MGCSHSARVFVVNPTVAGQGEAVLEVFKILGLNESEVNVLFSIFSEIDSHKTGSIRPVELYSYFNVETGELEKSIFMVFDQGNTGKMNFVEFVVAMWNFLSLPESLAGAVIYLIKDPTGTYRITLHQVRELFEIVHRRKVETSPVLAQLFNDFKQRYPLEILLSDFCKWQNANSTFLTPVVILQIKLRKNIIGEAYWQRRAKAREQHATQGQLAFVYQLHGIVRRVNDEYYHRMQEAKQKDKPSGISDSQRAAVLQQSTGSRKALSPSSSPVVTRKSQSSLQSGEESISAAGSERVRRKSGMGLADMEARSKSQKAKPLGQSTSRKG